MTLLPPVALSDSEIPKLAQVVVHCTLRVIQKVSET